MSREKSLNRRLADCGVSAGTEHEHPVWMLNDTFADRGDFHFFRQNPVRWPGAMQRRNHLSDCDFNACVLQYRLAF